MPPKALLNRPDLGEHLHFVWSAYHAVSADRPVGFGLASIPFAAIDRFARRYGITDIDEFDRLRRLIGEMDRAMIEDAQAEQKNAENKRK